MARRACVIYNPAAGRGKAARLVQRRADAEPGGVVLMPTARPGHAGELARAAVADGFERVIAAGGDGTVHEVANGLLGVEGADPLLGVWPLGSGNDYAFTLGLLGAPPGAELGEYRADVGRVTAGGRSRHFVNGCGLGFNSAVTVESRKIPLLRGLPLYGLAIVRAMVWHWVAPPMAIRFGDVPRDLPTFGLTVNLGQREGAFPLTMAASLTDGLFDCIHTSDLSRLGLVRLMPAMASGKIPSPHRHVWTTRCSAVTIAASAPVRLHLDGEFFCHPKDGLTELSIELLPARLRVQCFPARQSE